MGISSMVLGWRHPIVTAAQSSSPPPENTYVTEDGSQEYVTEDGSQPYVPEI